MRSTHAADAGIADQMWDFFSRHSVWLAVFIFASPRIGYGVELRRDCPGRFFEKRSDGLCHYAIPYGPGTASHRGNWLPLHPTVDRLDPRMIDLGRYLFFEPILSRQQDLSCAHCHDPNAGLSDQLPVAQGAGAQGVGGLRRGGVTLSRNTPSLWNVGLLPSWFWDGRAKTLGEQLAGPLYSPHEMAASPELIESRLNTVAEYRRLFKQVFSRHWRGSISSEMVVESLVAFERSLLSFDSRFDRYMMGVDDALDAQEKVGFNLFRSFLTRCAECHTPPLFTNHQKLFIGVPLAPGDQAGLEARIVKVPTLRNLQRTAPYMHAGQFANLDEVVEFYNNGGGRALGVQPVGRIHWHVRPIGMTQSEQKALVAFLRALDDDGARIDVPVELPSGLSPLK